MIDIHTHVLPGLDDGARTVEESLEMLRIAASSGTTDVVATPHASAGFAFDEQRVQPVSLHSRKTAFVGSRSL